MSKLFERKVKNIEREIMEIQVKAISVLYSNKHFLVVNFMVTFCRKSAFS